MSYSKLINPKKKRRVFVSREPPFPIPIASITGEQSTERQWMYYTGNLVGNQVIVPCTGDISHLYKMGFFGKGTLSRSKPEFNQKCKVATLPTSEGEDVTCRVTSRRSYIRRLNWKKGNEGPEFEEFDSSQELSEEETCFMDEEAQNTENSCTLSISKKEDHGDTDEKAQLNGPEISQFTEKDDWSAAVESWDNTEGDKDFWGVPSTDGSQPSTSKVETGHNDFAVGKHKINVWESSEGDKNFWGNETKNVVTSPDKQTDLTTEHSCLEELPQGDSKSTSVDQSKLLSHCDHNDCLKNSQVEQHVQCLHKTKSDSFEKNKIDLPNAHDKEMEDPLSLCEEKHGNLFVIEDSDDEMESRKRKKRWKSVIKEDPYFVKEFLHLSLEESFFLAYGLGCLRIYENEKLLNLTELWSAFCLRHDRFVPLYVAYHYFRSRGWVPKSGLKFGADFIIYKEGPPFYHGSYSVIVKMVREQDFQEEEKSRTLTWTQLAGLNRLTEHVAKQLLICYVIKPENVTADLMASPKVIGQFKVKEIVVSRWVSSQERESKNSAEEMP